MMDQNRKMERMLAKRFQLSKFKIFHGQFSLQTANTVDHRFLHLH